MNYKIKKTLHPHPDGSSDLQIGGPTLLVRSGKSVSTSENTICIGYLKLLFLTLGRKSRNER